MIRPHHATLAAFVALAALFPAAPAAPATPADSAAAALAAAVAARDPHLPASELTAKAVLNSSPRHGEYADIRLPDGSATVRAWVSYPERKDKAGVVLIIHEIFGLSDWIRAVADQLASEGFIAIAPDLISGMGPGGGGTDSAASRDDVVKLVMSLPADQCVARLDAVRDYAVHLPAASGKYATIGFCWGGGRSFAYAASPQPPVAAVVYYGTSPDSAMLTRVRAPVLGHYGGDDARVVATIEPAKLELAKLGRSYDPHVYEGAGHGFLRAQELRDGANLKATQQAWPQTIAFLKKYLK
jgi:carboxymethylenebutenolidase